MQPDAMSALVITTGNRIKRAWITAVAHLRQVNTTAAVVARLAAGPDAALEGLRDAAVHFAAEQRAAYVAAGQATARWLGAELAEPVAVAKKLIGFDIDDPPSVAWATTNQLDKIRQITEDQRAAIREILIRAARSGENPLVVAREIRDSIGLTDAQIRMVDSYRAALERGQYAAALERELSSGISDRAIAAAQRAGRALTTSQIDTAVERYRHNAIVLRAETIARTEGLRVAHQGSEELYCQAISRGDLEASQIERTWNTTHDERVRTTHEDMNGQRRAYGDAFESAEGALLAYPGDPDAPAKEVINCRCVISTRVRLSRSAASSTS